MSDFISAIAFVSHHVYFNWIGDHCTIKLINNEIMTNDIAVFNERDTVVVVGKINSIDNCDFCDGFISLALVYH